MNRVTQLEMLNRNKMIQLYKQGNTCDLIARAINQTDAIPNIQKVTGQDVEGYLKLSALLSCTSVLPRELVKQILSFGK
ncbi:hypothetical protein LRP52_40465 [Photobacterium sp. ZSDE20]|uniref:Transcriptional regulator n=1 Tax=Photobacterium pectinilyticum TaxID=2906793 RepID=A0ABT1N7P8_9GAMM|nr:hypothetical protein [Photobacterium sp. ZSDE20]MCQ1060768.1 hypothetical protein [Photobacterium sp. ZSDE20]MDD1828457.1 hypothetical protein [Photobacterium sp. ZSDE20]